MAHELSEDDKFRVHGYVGVAGLEKGKKYVVKDVVKVGRKTYVVESVDSGQRFTVLKDKLERYIDVKSWIEVL